MPMFFETRSGAVYEIDGARVRRIEGHDGNTKRRDGEWVRVHQLIPPTPTVGMPVTLVLESLADYGTDDYGTTTPGPVTTRVTTPVTRIWEEP